MKEEENETNKFFTIMRNPHEPLKCLATIQHVPREGFKDCTFYLEIICPENYPIGPPSIRFLNPVASVPLEQIDADGHICIDMFEWCPVWTLRGLVDTICSLLAD
jgi:ubiquitin-protein ligase